MSEVVPGRLRGRPEMSLRCSRRACMVMSMLTTTPQMAGSRDQGGRVALTRDEVMTASEVAELLHLPVSTVYYLARRGELPASRLGRTWRFLRPRIERLLNE
jgi:excisionase family DNA binding protein